jgi:hypothetical protein
MRNWSVTFMLLALVAFAQDSPEQVIEKISPSVASVLVGSGGGNLFGIGSAVVIQENGILLTAYHVVKNAGEVQIRFKDGETFDDVQLLGVDQRRDIAALRITATHLPALQVKPISELKAGAAVYVVSQAGALPWTASSGIISAIRMADEVPGAGNGYRLVQFTAPTSPGSSGGVLVDSNAHLIGVIVGSATGGQNLNFAVPSESVLGLANASPTLTFRPGSKLNLPAATPHVAAKPAEGIDLEGPEKSDVIASRDTSAIMRKFRTVYAHSNTVWMNQEVLKNALRRHPDFAKLGLVLVDTPKLADVKLIANRVLFTWDWAYILTHQNTSIILTTGKFTRIDGMTGASAIADDFLKKVKAARSAAVEEKELDQPKADQKPKTE